MQQREEAREPQRSLWEHASLYLVMVESLRVEEATHVEKVGELR